MKMYMVYFGDNFLKSFTDQSAAFSLAYSLTLFNFDHDTDYKIFVKEDNEK